MGQDKQKIAPKKMNATAGELEKREDVTHVMVDDTRITKLEVVHIPSVSHGKSHQIRTKHQHKTYLRRHNNLVQQWMTNGLIMIIGHDFQHIIL